jgi:hypothetical protein
MSNWNRYQTIGKCEGTSKVRDFDRSEGTSSGWKKAAYLTAYSLPKEFDPDIGDYSYSRGCAKHYGVSQATSRKTKDARKYCGVYPAEGDLVDDGSGAEPASVCEYGAGDNPCVPKPWCPKYLKKVTVKEGHYYGNHITTVLYGKDEDGLCTYEETVDTEGYCSGGFFVDPDAPAPEPDPITGITPPATQYNFMKSVTTVNGSNAGGYGPGGCGGDWSYPGETWDYKYNTTTTTENYKCFEEDTSVSSGTSSYSEGTSYCDGSSYVLSCTSSMTNGVWTGSLSGGGTVSGPCTNEFGETETTNSYSEPVPYHTKTVTLSNVAPSSFSETDWEEWVTSDVFANRNHLVVENLSNPFFGEQVKYNFGSYVQNLNVGEEYTALMFESKQADGLRDSYNVNSGTCFREYGVYVGCIEYSMIKKTFTATSSVKFFDCSLHPSISESDFINNNYSKNPVKYGLADDQLVVGSPTQAIPLPPIGNCLSLNWSETVNQNRTYLL